jgi:hypothetical protein
MKRLERTVEHIGFQFVFEKKLKPADYVSVASFGFQSAEAYPCAR